MAKATRPAAKPPNRRGSPEAIEKRRVARFFNDVLGGRASSQQLDGRPRSAASACFKELETGKARGSRELKPLDVLLRVQELLDLGEGVARFARSRR